MEEDLLPPPPDDEVVLPPPPDDEVDSSSKKKEFSSPAPVSVGSTSSASTLSMDVLKPQNNPKTPDLTGVGAFAPPTNLQDFNKPQETERVEKVIQKRIDNPTLLPVQQAAQQTPSRDTHFLLGNEYLKSGDYEQAIMSFDEAANFPAKETSTLTQDKALGQQIASNDDALAYGIGQAYQKLGKVEDAKRMYQVAIEKNPKNADAKTALAWNAFKEGDKEAAKKFSEEANADYSELIPAQPDLVGESEYEVDKATQGNLILKAAEGIILGDDAALSLISPIAFGRSFVEGGVDLVKGMGENLKEAIDLENEYQRKLLAGEKTDVSDFLLPQSKLIEGAIKGGFAYMQATQPEVFAAWHLGNATAEAVLPEDIIKTIMTPASQIIDNAGNDKLKQSVTNILDTFGNLVIFHKLSGAIKPKELARKVKNNEPLNGEETKAFVEALEKTGEEEANKAVEKTEENNVLQAKKEELNNQLLQAEETIKNIPVGETPAEKIEAKLLKQKVTEATKPIEEELTKIIEKEHEEVAAEIGVEQPVESEPEKVKPAKVGEGAAEDYHKKLTQKGIDLGFEKPQRADFEDGESGDKAFADANVKHNNKVDEVINNITESGVITDSEGNKYSLTITGQGVRVVNLLADGTEGTNFYYRKGRRGVETPFTNGFRFKPNEKTEVVGEGAVKEEQVGGDVVTFKGKRGQADSILFDGKEIKQGEEIELTDVNISQDDSMPDLRSGKYKVRMLSVDANGKTATLTLTDGNEVITTTVKDLRKSEKPLPTQEAKAKEEPKVETEKENSLLSEEEQFELDNLEFVKEATKGKLSPEKQARYDELVAKSEPVVAQETPVADATEVVVEETPPPVSEPVVAEEKPVEEKPKIVKLGESEYELTIDEKGKASYRNIETGKLLPDTTDRYYKAEAIRRKETVPATENVVTTETAPPAKAKDIMEESEEVDNVKDDKEALKKIETDKDIFKAEKSLPMVEKRYKGNSDRLKKALDEKKISKSTFNKIKGQLDDIYDGKKEQIKAQKEAADLDLKVGIKQALGIKPGDTATQFGIDSNALVDKAVELVRDLVDAVDEAGAKLYDAKEAVGKVVEHLKKTKAYKDLFDKKVISEEDLRKNLEKEFSKSEEPPAPKKPTEKAEGEKGKNKKLKLGKRLLASKEVPDSLKKGLQEQGVDYVPVELKLTNEAAKSYVEYMRENDSLDDAFNHVMNTENGMDGLTRATIGSYLFDAIVKKGREATDLSEAAKMQEKAIQLALFTAKNLKTAGQEINAGKMWKKMLGKIPEAAIVELTQHYEKANEAKLEAEKGNIEDAKKILKDLLDTPEFKEWVEKEYSKKSAPKETSTPKKENIFNSKSFRDKRREELKEKWKTASSSTASSSLIGLNKEQIEIVGEYAAIYVAEGVHQFVKLAKKLKKDFPELTEKQIKHIWENYKVPADIDSKQRTLSDYTKIGVFENMPAEMKQKLVDKWDKRLTGMKPEARKKLLADSILEIERSGVLSDAKFKEIYAEALGLPTVTPELSSRVTHLVNTINEGEDAMSRVKKLFDDNAPKEEIKAALADLEKRMFAARQANDELANFFKKEKRLGNTWSSILQLNLLSPMSIIQSFYSNVLRLPFSTLARGIASSVDYVESKVAKITGTERLFKEERTSDALAYWKGRFLHVPPSVKTGFKELVYGIPSENLEKREMHQKIEPFKAAAKFYEGLSGAEKQTFYQQMNNFSEALFGIPAAAMGRLLNLTDTPFTDSSKKALAREIGVMKGLKGNELEKFILEPDAEYVEGIEQESLSSTYQETSGLIKKLTQAISDLEGYVQKGTEGEGIRKPLVNPVKLIGDVIKLVTTSQKPYIKTPLNIVKDVIEWSIPQYTFARASVSAAKGNRREANAMYAKAAVGFMMQSVYQNLASNGLIQSPMQFNQPRKDKKIELENIKSNALNKDGLLRFLSGGSPKPQDGDYWVDLTKMGVPGITMGVQAQLAEDTGGKEFGTIENIGKTAVYTTHAAFEMSFLQGTNALLNALKGGESDVNQWLINTSEALSSVVVPNTISAISKAQDIYIDEKKLVPFPERLANNFKHRLFSKKEMPSIVSMWGDKVRRVPEGENPYTYMLFDIRKGKEVSTNSIGYKLYEIWDRLPDTDEGKDKLFPPVPEPHFQYKMNNVSHKINLTPELYESFCEHIGKQRKLSAQAYVMSEDFVKDSLKQKTEKLEKFYKNGRDNGLRLFKMEHKQEIDKIWKEENEKEKAKKKELMDNKK